MGQSILVGIGATYAMTGMAALFSIAIEKAAETFARRPEQPAPPPPECMNISQDLMIRQAKERIGMDVSNNYNYAICGPRGTGKSSFINGIRKLDDPSRNDRIRDHDERSAAPICITETTDEIRCYKFPLTYPNFQHIAIWDIPGSSTVDHPIDNYFRDQVLYAFDCIIITSSGNFAAEQIKIMTEAQKYNTPVILLVTRLDEDIANQVKMHFSQKRNYHPSLLEYCVIVEETIQQLKSYVANKQNIVLRSRIFVVSVHKFRDYLKSLEANDFPNAGEDHLLSGEMDKLIQYLAHHTVTRRNR